MVNRDSFKVKAKKVLIIALGFSLLGGVIGLTGWFLRVPLEFLSISLFSSPFNSVRLSPVNLAALFLCAWWIKDNWAGKIFYGLVSAILVIPFGLVVTSIIVALVLSSFGPGGF